MATCRQAMSSATLTCAASPESPTAAVGFSHDDVASPIGPTDEQRSGDAVQMAEQRVDDCASEIARFVNERLDTLSHMGANQDQMHIQMPSCASSDTSRPISAPLLVPLTSNCPDVTVSKDNYRKIRDAAREYVDRFRQLQTHKIRKQRS